MAQIQEAARGQADAYTEFSVSAKVFIRMLLDWTDTWAIAVAMSSWKMRGRRLMRAFLVLAAVE